MRLMIVSSEFPPGPGGIGNHAHQLALNLQRMGWKIVVLSSQDYATAGEIEKFNSRQPFKVVKVHSGRKRLGEAFHRFGIAWRLAQDHKPSILLGSGVAGVWVASALGAIRRLPSVAVAHGSEFGMNQGVCGAVNRWAYQRAAAVIAVSQFTRRIVEQAGVRPKRIEVIPNAADQSRFFLLPQSERQLFRKKTRFNGGPLLLTVGHVSERKGQEVVIRAMPHIMRKLPNAHYVMIGLPTLKPELTKLAEQLGVSDRVHFLGSVPNGDMVGWLNCCDLFLMTSRVTAQGDCEGFGIAVVEAALCGKPAVVSNNSGLIEAIRDGTTGLAVPEDDENATAEAVVSLMSDPTRRLAMGEAARKHAEKTQTWPTCARLYDSALRSLVTPARKIEYVTH
jgi:phosphatidylinositol alpha-1,6-mannosyltransferase